jgi:hypothetical protein
METQTASDQTTLAGQTSQASGVNGGEESAREARVLWEERERRRVQFRLSLNQARSYPSRAVETFRRPVPAKPQ